MREIHNIVNDKLKEIRKSKSISEATKSYYYALGCIDYARAHDEISEERHYFMIGHLKTEYENVHKKIHSNNIDQSLDLGRENTLKNERSTKTAKITRIC